MTRYVSRDELIEFMKRWATDGEDPSWVASAEAAADAFIREFFGVEPLPEPVHQEIIDLDTMQIDPQNDYVALFVEHAPGLGQTRGEARVVVTKRAEEET